MTEADEAKTVKFPNSLQGDEKISNMNMDLPLSNKAHSTEDTVPNNKLHEIQNPTMERLQQGLRNQLQQSYQRAKQALVDQDKNLRTIQREREDVGVQLYELQKQLSIMQTNRNDLQDKHGKASEHRQRNDQSMETIRKNLSDRQDILQKTKKQRVDAKSKLDEVLESLRLAREWNRDIKHEVAVSRRSAHKVEDIVRDLEKNKKSQDLLLDQLSEQIRSVSSNVAILTEELEAQRQQTTDTKEALMVTKDELDRLTSEKKQLVQQWTSSILARNRREKALSECMRAYQEKQDTLTEAMREISLLRVEFTSVKDETQGFVLNRNRLEHEVKYVQMEIEKLGGSVENTAREFEMLQQTIAMSQERQVKMNQLKNKIDAEIASTTHKMDLVLKERQKLESSVHNEKDIQSTKSQEASVLLEETLALADKIREKEMESALVQNNIARASVKRIDTEGHILQLQGELDKEMKRFQDKEALIAKVEGIIRKTHDDIVGKMNRVDLLNQRYLKMTNQTDEPEPLGPLEATIKSLKTTNANESLEVDALQHKLFTTQQSLVRVTGEVEAEQSHLREDLLRLDILKKQSLRLSQILHKNECELKSFDVAIRGMQLDLSKLNEFIDRKSKVHTDVTNDIIVINQDKERNIKQVQEEIKRIGQDLEENICLKSKRVNELLDLERQILQWEKKIQLEKETRTALTSSEHAFQVKGMEKEINRMTILLGKLKRKEESIVREIEQEMQKKEELSCKYFRETMDAQGPNEKAVTVLALTIKSEELKGQIQSISKELSEINSKLIDANASKAELESYHSQLNSDCTLLHNRISGIREEIHIIQSEKERFMQSKMLYQEVK